MQIWSHLHFESEERALGQVDQFEGMYRLLEGRHSGDVEQGTELDRALDIEMGVGCRLQELFEGALEEGVVLLLGHLQCIAGAFKMTVQMA